MISPLLLLLIKASAVLALSLAAARLLRGDSAGRRHFLWSGAFLALITLPLLAVVLPPIEVEALRQPAVPPMALAPERAPTGNEADKSATIPAPSGATALTSSSSQLAAFRLPSLREAVVGLWVIGFSAAMLALLVSLARVQLLARRGELVA